MREGRELTLRDGGEQGSRWEAQSAPESGPARFCVLQPYPAHQQLSNNKSRIQAALVKTTASVKRNTKITKAVAGGDPVSTE